LYPEAVVGVVVRTGVGTKLSEAADGPLAVSWETRRATPHRGARRQLFCDQALVRCAAAPVNEPSRKRPERAKYSTVHRLRSYVAVASGRPRQETPEASFLKSITSLLGYFRRPDACASVIAPSTSATTHHTVMRCSHTYWGGVDRRGGGTAYGSAVQTGMTFFDVPSAPELV